MKFVDRKSELAVMERAFKGAGFQFIPVYGRRRVGKTRLVQEFIEGKEAVYFLADSIAETEQLKSLGRVVGEHFRDTILMDSGFKDWEQIFRYMKEKGRGRLVVIIDEFPYLVYSNRAVSSIFQKGIDEQLKHSNIFLILMGSSIGMMEKEVLLYKAPLYGRRTGSLEVTHQRRYAPISLDVSFGTPGWLSSEQVDAFLQNRWTLSPEYADDVFFALQEGQSCQLLDLGLADAGLLIKREGFEGPVPGDSGLFEPIGLAALLTGINVQRGMS